ncbi:MAG: alpha/beta hydrolase [Thiotrichales bacterium]|nr:alpha/beta hydrolase [Thiotrichales bacterium]
MLHGIEARQATARTIASDNGFQGRLIDTGEFSIQTWSRDTAGKHRHLEMYIEGDGLAWRRKNRLSKDPTPVDPLALRLAARVPAGPVVYLARPCQYTRDAGRGLCRPELWSSHRYSEAVLSAMNRAIDDFKTSSHAGTLTLLGYSGGGVIAALLAARRDDVTGLITIAANLDHAYWTSHHQVTPLSGSLNPVDYAAELRRIPQMHFVGAEDETVNTATVRSYLDQLGLDPQRSIRVIAGADHDCCWVSRWPELRKLALQELY